MMVQHMSASTVHLHRLNTLTTSVILHLSRVGALTTCVAHVELLSFVARPLPENGSRETPRRDLYYKVHCEQKVCHQPWTSVHAH